MRMVDMIAKKRDGKELTPEEIQFVVNGYVSNEIPDYQMSAFLMAVYFQGMSHAETAQLTLAMASSGDRIDLSTIDGIKVDKHSTGGVGDTTSIILAPLVAALGIPVAKMSGRGLGHTGGTIDKLEAIPGYRAEVSEEEFIRLVNQNKLAIVGQSGNLAPADKMIYGLRDVTATVNSIPLIASSIMSKKIAAGADAIVLDVKTGSGAFMKKFEDARLLANTMVEIGNQVGRKTMAVISDMSQPLGNAIGNALEVKEGIETLQGRGPADLTELCLVLGSKMIVLAEKAESEKEARELLEKVMKSGEALQVFKQFLAAQGGDVSVVDNPEKLPKAVYQIPVASPENGYVSAIKADEIGTAAMLLGAGRVTKESDIDLSVGVMLHKKIGDRVHSGESIATIHSNVQNVSTVMEKIVKAYRFSKEKIDQIPLIRG
ncbi:pyrimidine-nucleoside phosphorylase [Bacillus thermophilus]|uniref:Pyrimidine-nucleoside phosphorylase n=1 Tax=Siminovitchia thermophila TaxID=1245522 RepID=A0ABS2R3C0_9BACI|nr:pyrimidine-nucleoside phosphorylase [Siminovitchia thermophila]MBM7714122.1 pyrimidine-nucleoside phosphorylase [Siminovitchia thermophila]ONK24769.1 pyrimidine-nucleoside phosphorylase [Bacillus sp. VT-16-64]